MLGALRLGEGLTAMMTVDSGTDGEVFVAYLEQVLLPELREGDLVVMDNLGAHKDRRVKEILASVGATPIYLPPYSPDLNPIELAWAKLKSWLQAAEARTREALETAINVALAAFEPADAAAWFRCCGYRWVVNQD